MKFFKTGVFFLATTAWAQQYVISTIAGGPPATPIAGLSMPVATPEGIAADAAGNVYFVSLRCVYKLDQTGVVTRIAGNSGQGHTGDGGPATNATLFDPRGLALDRNGNLFISDYDRVRRISPSGTINTVAGGGTVVAAEGGPATSAQLALYDFNKPAVDASGNLFFADASRIRKVSADGILTTVAGNGTMGDSGDGGLATNAELSAPSSIAVDSMGNLFIGDAARIRKISTNGIITTVAGNGGPIGITQLSFVRDLAIDASDNLFIAGINRVAKLSATGTLTEIAGNGLYDGSGDGGPATSAEVEPVGIATDAAGNVFISDSASIRRISRDGIITRVAGTGDCCFSGDGGPAINAQVQPSDVAIDSAGNLFIAENGNRRVRKISPDGIITTVAGDGALCYIQSAVNQCGPAMDGGPATSEHLQGPQGVALDGGGNVFIADSVAGRVRKVSPTGIITTVAGTAPGPGPSTGDGGPATSAQVSYPFRVTVDQAGSLFLSTNERIRKVTPDGIITTMAGTDAGGFTGDGGPAASALLFLVDPAGCDGPGGGLALDPSGNLWIADSYNNRVREVSTNGIIDTTAGGSVGGFSGDGGPAVSAELYSPWGVAFDSSGNLFVTDHFNARIRKIAPNGIITTVAGNGTIGFAADGSPATQGELAGPAGIAVDRAGNIYFTEEYNNTVRVLRPTNNSVLVSAVVDAASQQAGPVSPGKLVVIYGAGLGPAQLVSSPATNGQLAQALAGTTVSFNGIAAPLLYASANQVAAIVPYAITGTSAQIQVAYKGATSAGFTIPVAPSAPGIFTLNQTGGGQAAALNVDGTANTAATPVGIGGYISLFATGEGQTTPSGVDGLLTGSALARPILPVTVTIGGTPAKVVYAGSAPGQVAGVMQVNVQIPSGIAPGGYVPVALRVGDASTPADAVWIAVSGN